MSNPKSAIHNQWQLLYCSIQLGYRQLSAVIVTISYSSGSLRDLAHIARPVEEVKG